MKILSSVIFCTFLAFAYSEESNSPKLNGKNGVFRPQDSLVYIKNSTHYLCSGALFHVKRVLTLAYFIQSYIDEGTYDGITVMLGGVPSLNSGTPHHVKNIMTDDNEDVLRSRLAVIILLNELNLSESTSVSVIKLAETPLEHKRFRNLTVISVGWDQMLNAKLDYPDSIIVKKNEILGYFKSDIEITNESHVGGLLVLNEQLIGMFKFKLGIDVITFEIYYANIINCRKFIQNVKLGPFRKKVYELKERYRNRFNQNRVVGLPLK